MPADDLAVRVSDGPGEAVLWVHGYTLDSGIWDEVWACLPGRRHVGVDLPGHGRSPPLRARETLPELARRLAAIAERHRAEHVVGLSFGGMVALQMAIESPASFRTLTLSSPAVGGAPAEPSARARNRELTRLYRERGAGPWLRERWMSWPPDIFRGAAAHPELWRTLVAAVDRHSWAELGDAGMQRLTGHVSQLRELRRIQAAVLVLVGEHDMPTFKRSAELLRRDVDRCERVYCEGSGHLPLLEDPSGLAPAVERHLSASS